MYVVCSKVIQCIYLGLEIPGKLVVTHNGGNSKLSVVCWQTLGVPPSFLRSHLEPLCPSVQPYPLTCVGVQVWLLCIVLQHVQDKLIS